MKTKIKRRTLWSFGIAICLLLPLIFGAPFAKTEAKATTDFGPDLSMFFFTKVGTTHYSVALIDDEIEHVRIPPSYKGLPVKEITSAGFSYYDNLKSVHIPESIKKIGNSAFMGCGNLEYVNLLEVETVGQSAFSSCDNLKKIAFPDTVQSIGANVLKYSSPEKVFVDKVKSDTASWTNWLLGFGGSQDSIIYDYDEIEYNDIKDEVTEELIGYSVWRSPKLNAPDNDLVLDFHKGLPVSRIQANGFKNAKLRTLSIGTESDHEIQVESGAFAGSAIQGIWLDNNIEFVGDFDDSTVPATNLFTNSSVQTVILPDELSEISETMFSRCTQLTTLRFVSQVEANILPASIKTIKAGAFFNCSLPFLSIPFVKNIDVIDSNGATVLPFGTWKNKTVGVSFSNSASKPSGWANNWYGESAQLPLYSNASATNVKITFDKNDGTNGASEVQATYGKSMPSASAPTRSGYSLLGYFSAEGILYYTADMQSARICDLNQDTTLFAIWVSGESDSNTVWFPDFGSPEVPGIPVVPPFNPGIEIIPPPIDIIPPPPFIIPPFFF